MNNTANIIMITGANSYVGQRLIKEILFNTCYHILAFGRNYESLESLYKNYKQVKCFDNNEIKRENDLWDNIDCIVHLAFARKLKPESEIANSLLFAKEVFKFARNHKVKGIINVSSQNVYGNNIQGIKNESCQAMPENVYSMGKYATEVIMDAILEDQKITKSCIVRLDSIAGNKNFIPTLVKNAIEKQEINIAGGKQEFSLNDVRDIALGLRKLLEIDKENWKPIYNLGNNRRVYNIVKLAEIVKQSVEKRLNKKVVINIVPKEINLYAGIDSSLFMKDTGWQPKYNIYDIVDKIIDEYLENKNLLLIGE